MSTGTFEGVEALLDEAERWLAEPRRRDATMSLRTSEEFLRLPAEIAVHRAGLALVGGDLEATVTFARRALEIALPDDHLARAAASALQGLAAWTTGDLELAHASYAGCLVDFERIGHVSDVLGCSITLADIQVAQGRLGAAMRTYEQALDLAARQGAPGTSWNRGHVRRSGRPPPRVRRPAGSPERPDAESRARRAHRAAPERVPLADGHGAGLRGRGRLWRPRTTCSSRRSGSTRVTSRPTSGRCLRCGHARGSGRDGCRTRSTGPASRACTRRTTSATSTSSSTSPWPGR